MSSQQSLSIPVAFDVLGTCFSFDPAVEALRKLFPEQIKSDRHGHSLVQDWFHTSQRDFTYISMNDAYTPIAQILKATLPRILLMNNIMTDSDSSSVDLSSVVSILPSLPPRPSLSACSALLTSSSSPRFTLLAATNGALASTKGLFKSALGEEQASKWDYFSCDENKIAKPDPRVYEAVWKRLGVTESSEEKKGWFIASHTWDLFAAKKAGFKTAWVSYEEYSHMPDIWGTPDVIAKDLEDAARQIIEKEST